MSHRGYTVQPLSISQFERMGERACTVVCCKALEYFFAIGDSIDPTPGDLYEVLQEGCIAWKHLQALYEAELPPLLNPFDVIKYAQHALSISETLEIVEEFPCVISRHFQRERSGELEEFGVQGILQALDRMAELSDAIPDNRCGIGAVLVSGGLSYCLWLTSDDRMWLFDSHRRHCRTGLQDPDGAAVLVSFLASEMTVDYLEAMYGAYDSVTTAASIEQCDIQHHITSVYIIASKKSAEPAAAAAAAAASWERVRSKAVAHDASSNSLYST